MSEILRIGEYQSLGAAPIYHHLQRELRQDHWNFIPGTSPELDGALVRGELDITLVSPLALAGEPLDYLVLPGLGYGARRKVRDLLLFSDMLLDDMDEMTISIPGEMTGSAMLQVITGKYIQYQNQFITGWGSAEAFLLAGDAAFRELLLSRYAYVYDLGDLWRHYTGKAMTYSVWAVKKETFRRRKQEIYDFHHSLRRALEMFNPAQLAAALTGYEWVNRPQFMTSVWSQLDYILQADHQDGLDRFFADCAETGVIEEPPEFQYLEV